MIEVRFDESSVPGIEDEAIEVEHLLAEPKNEHVSVDGALCFDSDNQGKCLEVKDVSCRFEAGLKAYNGGLDSNTILGGQDDLNFGVLDGFLNEGFLDEVDDIEDIHATDGLSSPCDDYLLDIEFGEKFSELVSGPHEASRLGNSSSESHSPGISGASNGAVGVSASSTETTPEQLHDQNMICKLHGVIRSNCRCMTTFNDNLCQKSPASPDPADLDDLENDLKPLVGAISYTKKKNSSVETMRVWAHLRQKRTRKPTKRYIEESSNPKNRDSRGGKKISPSTSKDKHLKARSSNEDCHMRIMALAPVKEEESVSGASIQAPSEVRVRRGRPKKQQSTSEEFESDGEEFDLTTESEDDSPTAKRSRKSSDRRKHQRMWTLSEVTDLVDGISQYGVGRWTDIKRLLFSSSTYRTPIDLRDKWRNLLRASRAQKHNRREVEQNPKQHASRPLPKSLLHRISDLAALHPYPKEREPNLTSKVAKLNPCGRNVRRKKCT